MPRASKSTSKKSNRPTHSFERYVNVDLRPNESKQVDDLQEKRAGDVLIILCEWTEAGYSFTCKEDKSGDSYQATLFGLYEECPPENAGLILSARGSSAERCFWKLAYYHFALCDAGPWEAE